MDFHDSLMDGSWTARVTSKFMVRHNKCRIHSKPWNAHQMLDPGNLIWRYDHLTLAITIAHTLQNLTQNDTQHAGHSGVAPCTSLPKRFRENSIHSLTNTTEMRCMKYYILQNHTILPGVGWVGGMRAGTLEP